MKTILFQGDSITDTGRNRENIISLGTGYANMTAGKILVDYPGQYQCDFGLEHACYNCAMSVSIKPYSEVLAHRFADEKERLSNILGTDVSVEHVGVAR